MQIEFTLPGTSFTVTLVDGAAARGLVARLPLTLSFRDFHETEKIADLPARLPTAGEPPGIDPTVGDLTYYAPWGNLAFFYRDFGYAKGLVKLGALDGDPALLTQIRDGQEAIVSLVE